MAQRPAPIITTPGEPGWDEARRAWNLGELRRTRPQSGALAAVDADYLIFGGGLAPTPAMASAITMRVAEVKAAVAPWAARQMYLNFAETSRDPASFWSSPAYDRLRRIKAAG
jgi:hypothetical protein